MTKAENIWKISKFNKTFTFGD